MLKGEVDGTMRMYIKGNLYKRKCLSKIRGRGGKGLDENLVYNF